MIVIKSTYTIITIVKVKCINIDEKQLATAKEKVSLKGTSLENY